MESQQQNHKTGIALALLATFCFSFKAIFAKKAYGFGIDPLHLVSARLWIVAPFVTGFWYIGYCLRTGRRIPTISLRGVGLSLFMALTGYLGAMVLSFVAIEHILASTATFLVFCYPIFSIMIESALDRQRPSSVALISAAVALAGIGLVVNPAGDLAGSTSTIGILAAVAAGLTYACYNIAIARGARHDSLAMVVGATWYATIFLTFASGFTPAVIPEQSYQYVLGLGIITGWVPFIAGTLAVIRLGASQFGIFASLGPLYTALWASMLLGEAIGVHTVLGGGLIIVGVVSSRLFRTTTSAGPASILYKQLRYRTGIKTQG